jgi:pimeloyl-ACP methyl ester carboxylesterase
MARTIKLHVSGSGEVLLLVHGWTLDHRSFAAQAPLADDYRLVSFDRRGCGVSTAAPDLGAEPATSTPSSTALGADACTCSASPRAPAWPCAMRRSDPGRAALADPAGRGGRWLHAADGRQFGYSPGRVRRPRSAREGSTSCASALAGSPADAQRDAERAQQRALEEMVAGYTGPRSAAGTPAARPSPICSERLKTLDCADAADHRRTRNRGATGACAEAARGPARCAGGRTRRTADTSATSAGRRPTTPTVREFRKGRVPCAPRQAARCRRGEYRVDQHRVALQLDLDGASPRGAAPADAYRASRRDRPATSPWSS